jgi:hypothetical protein
MDRLARALGKTIDTHLKARDMKPTAQLSPGLNGTAGGSLPSWFQHH